MSTKAVLIHQHANASANIFWVPPLSQGDQARLDTSINALVSGGYWASPFPEGDGVTFSHESYDDETALRDMRSFFPWLNIEDAGRGRSIRQAMHDLNAGRDIPVRYLVPVDKLLIHKSISLAPYKIHRPVVPDQYTANEHPWAGQLLDIPGADTDPSWDAKEAFEGSTARLLGYPLIECTVQVDAGLFFPAESGISESESLALQVTEHADRVLDVLRHRFCHYQTPHYTPHHAGVFADSNFRIAYLMPDRPDLKPRRIEAKPQVFEAVNTWLGLEVDAALLSGDKRLAKIASGLAINDIEERIRGALRARGQSFLLVNDEMRFVSMIFAADAVSFVGRKIGPAQRRHIAAVASRNKRERYIEFLDAMNTLYPLRNKIVHEGASFHELRIDAKEALMKMDRILCLCIEEALGCDFASGTMFADAIQERVQRFDA